LAILSSQTSLIGTLRIGASDRVDPRAIAREWSALNAKALGASVVARQTNVIRPDRIVDVGFDDFKTRPIETMRMIYDHFEWAITPALEARFLVYLAENPTDMYGPHVHRFESTGLDSAAERARVRDYQRHFGVSSEVPA
jgi:hypothetical protein